MTILRTYAGALWQSQSLPREDKRVNVQGGRGRPPTILTEEKVLECRARYEFYGWPIRKCAKHYGLKEQYTRNLMNYQTRSFLIPEPKHANLEAS